MQLQCGQLRGGQSWIVLVRLSSVHGGMLLPSRAWCTSTASTRSRNACLASTSTIQSTITTSFVFEASLTASRQFRLSREPSRDKRLRPASNCSAWFASLRRVPTVGVYRDSQVGSDLTHIKQIVEVGNIPEPTRRGRAIADSELAVLRHDGAHKSGESRKMGQKRGFPPVRGGRKWRIWPETAPHGHGIRVGTAARVPMP
mmetsp:Transcript_25133/g.79627  ORF Transcript_25133/g.79627 Transcript_25133/m.79627 type:complete len:201 (+) Transcript_25133:689-1291(+)